MHDCFKDRKLENTGIQHKGDVLTATVNRTKPITKELLEVFKVDYHFYQGVASKYINNYNALFSITYQNEKAMIQPLLDTALAVINTNYYHNIKDVKEAGILTI